MEESQVQSFLKGVLDLCPKAAPEAREALESPHAFSSFISTQLDSQLRLNHFFAQVCHESGGLSHITENLNYTAARLMAVWPSRYDEHLARIHQFCPEDIANYVYAGRMGNRDPGDGWKYRGRGLIQITGLANYRQIGRFANIPLEADPDAVLEPDNLLLTACLWWSMNGCNELADTNSIEAVTRRVNGGLNGLTDRKAWLGKLEALWTS